MKKIKIISLLATLLLLSACEYEPNHENFIELTPPAENIPMVMTLNDVNPTDTIFIYQYTSIIIKSYTTKDLVQTSVQLDGNDFTSYWDNSLTFYINPEQLTEGIHKLTVKAKFSSGTGSLAELMGLEGYQGEISWNIRIVHDIENHFKFAYRINKEGFMEVYWENDFPDTLIEKYTLSGYTQNGDLTINDVAQKSFVDYEYVCGTGYYGLQVELKNGNSFLKHLYFEIPNPKLYFESLGLDKLRVYWDKPIANGKFDLAVDNEPIASRINDTSIIIPQLFGKNRQFYLETRPQKSQIDTYFNAFHTYDVYCQGKSLRLYNWVLSTYNKKDNIIYASRNNYLIAFDATTLQEINSVEIIGNPWGFTYGGKIATAPHNSTLAAMTGEETWIFNDSRFQNPVKISPLLGDFSTRLAALTSDDRFFVVQKDANTCNVFNSLTGEKIFDFPFTYKTIYYFPDFVTVSEDGQYFCASSDDGIEVFKVNGTTTSLLHTDTREYSSAIFLPSQPDKLFLRVNSDIEIRQMPDFTLIQKLDVSANGARICNIDPATMNLLYFQKDSLKVCNINNLAQTIFKIRSDERVTFLYNNKLLTFYNNGISFDISHYLSH